MDPAYAVYTAGGTRIGRRIIASLVEHQRTYRSDGTPKPARSNRRARRTPFLNPESHQALPYMPSGFPLRGGGLA